MLTALAILCPSLLIRRTINTDECLYAWVGKNIVMGHGISDWNGPHTMFPPGHPFLIGMVFRVSGNLELACRIVTLLAAIGAIWLIICITSRLFGDVAVAGVGMMAALNPSIIALTYLGGSEIPLVFFCCLAMLALARSQEGVGIAPLCAGLAIGAAYLIRPEGLLFIPIGIACLLWPWRRGRLAASVLFAAGILICVVPYAAFLHQQTGSWTFTGKSKTLAVDNQSIVRNAEKALYRLDTKGNGYSGDSIDVSDATMSELVSLPNYLRNIRREAGAANRMVGLPVLLLIILGLFSSIRKRQLPPTILPAILPIALLAALPLFFIRDRYLAPVVPMALILAAWGFSSGMKHDSRAVRQGAAVLLCASLLLGAYNAFLTLRETVVHRSYLEHMTAGNWLGEHSAPGEAVMSRKPWVPFYADRPWVITPLASLGDTLEFARRRGVCYLVVDQSVTAKARPALRPLLDPGVAPGDTKAVYVSGAGTPKVVIYRILPEDQAARRSSTAYSMDSRNRSTTHGSN